MTNETEKDNDGKLIMVHIELIEILEELRTKLDEFTYGSLNSNVGYKTLTHLLAKKIKKRGGVV